MILRGARQVGKTTLVTEFAKNFDFFISLNLEKAADKEFFKAYDDVNTIVEPRGGLSNISWIRLHAYMNQRSKFQNFGNSNYRSREVGEAMRNLDLQRLYTFRDSCPSLYVDEPVEDEG